MFKNATGVSLPMALWLATDFYDYNDDINEISVTSLLKPIRSIVLSRRILEQADNDVINMLAQSIGTAVHMNIEEAWNTNMHKGLLQLGYPDSVIKRIVINPETLTGDQIPVYMEKRSKKKVGKYTISGKYDFVINGQLTDFKTTKVYGWINGSNTEKYVLQGSMYRWLNPDIITNDIMCIDYVFTDWTALGVKTQKNYPGSAVLNEKFKLLSIEETEHFVQSQLNLIAQYEATPQEHLPRCNDDDLWRKDTVFKYYKNPDNKKRSTKNFATMGEAMDRLHADGSVGVVDEVKGSVVACKYCNALGACTQAEEYVLSGELQL